MTYFKDLTIYSYHCERQWPMQNNVGWLGPGQLFPTWKPSEGVLDLLWNYCKVRIKQTRGLHDCHMCWEWGAPHQFSWKGEGQHLGSAEIRVFSNRGTIFAAPNLIFHYVSDHGYRPPEEFLEALSETPCPPDPEYFRRLQNLRYTWSLIETR